MKDCVFCKIVRGEISKDFSYQDDFVLAFDDINPVAPIHKIIIPKEHIEDFEHVENNEVYVRISSAIKELISKTGLNEKGYKIVVNGGGAQDVFHLHFHLYGPNKASGRPIDHNN